MITQLASRYLAELDATMRRVVDDMVTAPDFGVMLRYPLGWVDQNGQPYNHPTGKRIRPILLLLATEATGGDFRSALPAAAAVELLHNFSLVHDDIEDDSPTRHGRSTVWTIWGRANAINAGDALFALAYGAMQRLPIPAEVALKVWGIFNATNIELTRGQHMDMRFEKQKTVSVDEYISMIRGKSAALVAACAQMGALIGSHDDETAAHFAEFGLNLGLAFQIRDDILGIWGDPAVTGKSAATDILSRKKSLPVLYGLSQSPELVELYAREPFGAAEVDAAVSILNAVDAQAKTLEYETDFYQQAMAALERAQPQGPAAVGLKKLTESLFQRAF
ncbi:MAG: polyprenyl synthetase family protein [Chloroflexi bacterium]|uniref:polyprenyl synthetase family protein n=1 Tax=Candidatus Flexifilum breve TaxID=3140694 RepID=UPI003135C69E|nr:polyprenyl synthetase family protein [Chloroflexota bacterium]